MSLGDFGLSVLTDGVKSAGGLLNSWVSGLMTNYWNKKSSRDNAALGYEYSKMLADYNRKQDYDYSIKYANAINDINYDLANRYAINSAKWSVQGLRRAGLNPIIAAGGSGVSSAPFGPSSPSYSSGGSSSISPSGSGFRADVSESARDFATLRVQDASAQQIHAQTQNVEAQTRLQDLSTAREAYNLLQHVLKEDEKGPLGLLFKGAKLLDPSDDRNRKAANRITEKVGRIAEKSLERALGLPSSASDSTAHDNTSTLSKVGTVIKNSASESNRNGWVNRVRRTSRRAVRAFKDNARSRPIGDFFLQ